MHGHANLANNNPDPEQPGNGGSNDLPEAPYPITLSTPGEWEGWEPTATETIVFTAETNISHPGEAYIKFHLSEVTNYQGRYMNDEDWKNHRGADLYFEPAEDQETEYGNKVTWEGGGKNSTVITARWMTRPAQPIVIPVKIVCNDYAAYGKIHAVLHVPHYKPKPTEPKTIPEDKNGNMLADAWDASYKNWWVSTGFWLTPLSEFTIDHLFLDRDHGFESGQSGVNSGDGFTLLEEYRGFYVGGSHIRLHPESKDFFVRSELTENNPIPWSQKGDIGYTSSLPMDVHSINADEWNETDYVVNFCRKDGYGEIGSAQCAVRITESNEMSGLAGHATWSGDPVNPNNVDSCEIYTRQIHQHYGGDAYQIYVRTIAHEVGHTVNLAHHWLRIDEPAEEGGEGIVTFPTNDVDACVMLTTMNDNDPNPPPITVQTHLHWNGTGFADFHNSPPDEPDWEDHWWQYCLHSNHEGHLTYDDN